MVPIWAHVQNIALRMGYYRMCLTVFDFAWLLFVCMIAFLRKFPLVLTMLLKVYLTSIATKWSQEVSKRLVKLQMYANSKFGPIFIFVNRFNLQRLVLTSYLLFIAIDLLRYLPCHIIFHYLQYHLVIWDHLLIVLTLFLTLIKTVTICHLFITIQILVKCKTFTIAPKLQLSSPQLYPCSLLSVLAHLSIWFFLFF
jgi:hypothetical protein